MLPLGLLGSGDRAEIAGIISGKQGACGAAQKGSEDICTRIENMGLRIGKAVEMLNNGGRGPLLVKVDESRIAIARGMSMKIMVKRVEG